MHQPQASRARKRVDEDEVRAEAESKWRRSPDLRDEFRDDKASYLAYAVAVAKGAFRIVAHEA